MSDHAKIGLGAIIVVGLMVGAGCSFGTGHYSKSTEYDFEALDFYLSDAKKVVRRADDAPLSLGRTASTKPLARSSASGKSKRAVPVGKFPKGRVFGHWVGKIDMVEAMESAPATGDPEMAEMARKMGMAMAEMMSGLFSMSFDLHKNYTFEGLMVSMPIEGNWVQNGDRLILTPTKVMGLTQEEAKKMSPKMAKSYQKNGELKMTMTGDTFEPMVLRIAERGRALIAINALDSTDQDLVFRRKS